jgi:hypothetical protein
MLDFGRKFKKNPYIWNLLNSISWLTVSFDTPFSDRERQLSYKIRGRRSMLIGIPFVRKIQ